MTSPNSAPQVSGKMRNEDIQFPKWVLIAAACLIAFTASFAYLARTTDIGATRLTPAPAVSSVELQFITSADGTLAIRDVQRNIDLKTLSPQSDGFIKIVLRSLAYERNLKGIEANATVRLSLLQDDQMILEDLATGRIITVGAFGWGNKAVFTELLDASKK